MLAVVDLATKVVALGGSMETWMESDGRSMDDERSGRRPPPPESSATESHRDSYADPIHFEPSTQIAEVTKHEEKKGEARGEEASRDPEQLDLFESPAAPHRRSFRDLLKGDPSVAFQSPLDTDGWEFR